LVLPSLPKGVVDFAQASRRRFREWQRSWTGNAGLLFQSSREAEILAGISLPASRTTLGSLKTKLVNPNASEQEKSVRWQTFWVTASLGAAFVCFFH
jgi:hypothetical protein